MSSLVSLAVVEGTELLCFREGSIVLDWLRTSDPKLVFDGVEDFTDGQPQRSEMIFRVEGPERT